MIGATFEDGPSPKRTKTGEFSWLAGGGNVSGGRGGGGGNDEELESLFDTSFAISLPAMRVDERFGEDVEHGYGEEDVEDYEKQRGPRKEKRSRPSPPSTSLHRQATPEASAGHTMGNPEELMVANENGKAMGAYVPSEYISLEEALQRFGGESESVRQYDREILSFLSEQVKRLESGRTPASRKRRHDDEDEDEGEDEGDFAAGPEGSSEDEYVSRALADIGIGRPSADLATAPGMSKTSEPMAATESRDAHKRRIELLCEHGADADREYILSQFAHMVENNGMTMDELKTRFCPLCGFMDNTQDAIGDREFEMIGRFADAGVGNMDEDTHAILLAALWNRLIYLPMRRRNQKVLPLTYKMAKAHVYSPHRFNIRVEKRNDAELLKRTYTVLLNTSLNINGMTGELKVNKTNLHLARQFMETKYKILGADDKKTTFRDGATGPGSTAGSTAGLSTNPLQAIRRTRSSYHHV